MGRVPAQTLGRPSLTDIYTGKTVWDKTLCNELRTDHKLLSLPLLSSILGRLHFGIRLAGKDPTTPEAVSLHPDQLLTWQKTIEKASDLCPLMAILVEFLKSRATMQVGQWPMISALVGQTNLFEDIRRKFSLGLAKYEVN